MRAGEWAAPQYWFSFNSLFTCFIILIYNIIFCQGPTDATRRGNASVSCLTPLFDVAGRGKPHLPCQKLFFDATRRDSSLLVMSKTLFQCDEEGGTPSPDLFFDVAGRGDPPCHIELPFSTQQRGGNPRGFGMFFPLNIMVTSTTATTTTTTRPQTRQHA